MTLASKLQRIKNEQDKEVKEHLIDEFLDDIEDHPKSNLLLDGLLAASMGRGFIDIGRSPFLPETLKDEGFVIAVAGPGFHILFDKEENN